MEPYIHLVQRREQCSRTMKTKVLPDEMSNSKEYMRDKHSWGSEKQNEDEANRTSVTSLTGKTQNCASRRCIYRETYMYIPTFLQRAWQHHTSFSRVQIGHWRVEQGRLSAVSPSWLPHWESSSTTTRAGQWRLRCADLRPCWSLLNIRRRFHVFRAKGQRALRNCPFDIRRLVTLIAALAAELAEQGFVLEPRQLLELLLRVLVDEYEVSQVAYAVRRCPSPAMHTYPI
jgi:hypothetical protein